MLFTFLAAMFLGRGQVNPPGTLVMPSQAAFYSATGGTANIEIRSSSGLPVPFVDGAGLKRSAVTVTLPAATGVGLGWLITQTKPDGTNYLTAITNSGQYSFLITMNCSATESPVGTYDSSVGVGNGIATGYPAPTASTPTLFSTGGTYSIGVGSVVAAVYASPPVLASGGLSTNGATTFASFTTAALAQSVTATGTAVVTFGSGSALASRRGVSVSNTGTTDMWVGLSATHHWKYIPAGTDRFIEAATGVTLYVFTATGTTTYDACEEGY